MDNKNIADNDPNLTAQLKAGLKRTYQERFELATRLYKVQQSLKKATITFKPYVNK